MLPSSRNQTRLHLDFPTVHFGPQDPSGLGFCYHLHQGCGAPICGSRMVISRFKSHLCLFPSGIFAQTLRLLSLMTLSVESFRSAATPASGLLQRRQGSTAFRSITQVGSRAASALTALWVPLPELAFPYPCVRLKASLMILPDTLI